MAAQLVVVEESPTLDFSFNQSNQSFGAVYIDALIPQHHVTAVLAGKRNTKVKERPIDGRSKNETATDWHESLALSSKHQ